MAGVYGGEKLVWRREIATVSETIWLRQACSCSCSCSWFGIAAVVLTSHGPIHTSSGTLKYGPCLGDSDFLWMGRFIMFLGVIQLKVGSFCGPCHTHGMGRGLMGMFL